MTALYIISFILLVVATAILLKLTPEQVGEDIENIIVPLNKQQTLKARKRKINSFCHWNE